MRVGESILSPAHDAQGGRISILNRELTLRDHSGTKTTRLLQSPEELLAALREHFGLRFPAGTEFPCPALDWSS